MKRTFVALLILFCWVTAVDAAVIFEDNFDSWADWNASGQYDGYECSPLAYGDSANHCPAGYYPGNGWTHFRSVPASNGGASPVISVRRPPGPVADHTGSGTGKAAIVYMENNIGAPAYSGDGNMGVFLGPSANYSEIYIQFWARTQSGMPLFTDGTQSKIIRLSHWRYAHNVYQWAAEHSPIQFWDWGQYAGNASFIPAYRCDASPGDYYCVNQSNNYQKNDTQTAWGGVPITSKFADGAWHRYTFHMKLNTSPGTYNGVWEFWYDGGLVEQRTNVLWLESSASAGTGWNHFLLGGNYGNSSNTSGVAGSYTWYAVDDFVVSTTLPAADYVPGAGSDTTAPVVSPFAMPATATSLTVNVNSFGASDNVAVTGYCITTTNSSAGCTWSGSAPTTATASSAGSVTWYAWARDAVGNVSTAPTATTAITLPPAGTATNVNGNFAGIIN